jgi:intein/homing endonuclease/DNA helicase HerA-like ATPase
MFDIFDAIENKEPKKKETPKEEEKTPEIKEEEKPKEINEKPDETEIFGTIINNEEKKPEEELNLPISETIISDTINKITEEIPLTFLENPVTDHVLVGRKQSVFNKYGEEAALYIGKVHEPNFPDKDVYFDSLDPQVVFVCGARGSGKCLTGDTEIILKDGTIKRIDELEKSAKIISMNNNFKLNSTKKEGFYERNVNKILEITLRSGKKIKLTPEHPLYTIDGWKPAKDINLKTKIATPRNLPFFGKEKIKKEEIKLLAYFITEGHLGTNFALFSNNDEKIVKDFKESVKSFDSNLRIEVHSKEGCYRVAQIKRRTDISGLKRDKKGQFTKESKMKMLRNSLIQYFTDLNLYNKGAKEKTIPDMVFKTTKNNLSLFLNRLFSCDGSIYYSNCWEVSYSSSCEKLINQVHHLLLRFGIVSKLREKKIKYLNQYVKSYEIVINGKFVEDFIDKIGFYGKKEKIAALAKKELAKIKYNPNLDTIPKEIFNQIEVNNWTEVGKKLGYKSPKSYRNCKRYNVSREKALKIGNTINNKLLKDLAKSDIYWDEIIKIKEIKKKTKVYDISVPENHNFVANNIIVHNSYYLGIIAEELALRNQNVGMVVVDPVGVFWSMKYPNKEKREIELLKDFNIEPQGLDNVVVFIPEGSKNLTPKETYDSTYTVQPSFLNAEDWTVTFGLDRFSPTGLLLEKVLKKVEEGYRTLDGLIFKPKRKRYDINDIIICLENDAELNSKTKGFKKDSIRALVSRFEASKSWGIFSKTGTPLIEISVPGQLTILDVSTLDENVAALLIGILARRILSARKISTRKHAASKMEAIETVVDLENDIPPTWLFIDEAHTLIPGGSIATPASKAIIEYVKQGRQPGCSLVFATQQPSAIDSKVLSQVGTLICYKLVFDDDIKAVFKRMPTVVPKDFRKPSFIKKLEQGIPIMADRQETTSRAFVLKPRPRMSQHEGRETQTAEVNIKYSEEEVLGIMVQITKNKLKMYDELDEHSMKTLLKILNMKYKVDVSLDKFRSALVDDGIKVDKDKYFIEKEDQEEEKYEEKIVYKTFNTQYEKEEMEGIIKRNTGWDNYSLKRVYRPVFKINYKVFNKDGSFVSDYCYIDPVKMEFIHYVDHNFIYSEGFNNLRVIDADYIYTLLKLPHRKGFDVEFLKDSTGFGEVKVKRMMENFIQLGLVRKERRGIKNVYYLIKHVDIPKKPLLKILNSLGSIPLHDEEVEKEDILDPRISMDAVRNLLGTVWGNIKIDEIDTLLREEYMTTNSDSKETAMFETHSGKKVE